MGYLRLLIIFASLGVMGWYGYQVFTLDEASIKVTASGGVPARYIQADETTLEDLQQQLKAFKKYSDTIYQDASPKLFGRKELFLP